MIQSEDCPSEASLIVRIAAYLIWIMYLIQSEGCPLKLPWLRDCRLSHLNCELIQSIAAYRIWFSRQFHFLCDDESSLVLASSGICGEVGTGSGRAAIPVNITSKKSKFPRCEHVETTDPLLKKCGVYGWVILFCRLPYPAGK